MTQDTLALLIDGDNARRAALRSAIAIMGLTSRRLQGEIFRLEDTQVNKAEVCDRLDLITCRSLITAASPDAPINGTTRAGASLETACPKTAIFV
jgi:hypothetical protein